eukprot:COSAG06_NODE_28983_length_564_cov_1.260215_1_plen_25_part_01
MRGLIVHLDLVELHKFRRIRAGKEH